MRCGSGETLPPALSLKMPVGIIVGALCFGGGIFAGIFAAKDFAEGNVKWRKRMAVALCRLLPGGWILSLTLF
jgi:hypothetical protein